MAVWYGYPQPIGSVALHGFSTATNPIIGLAERTSVEDDIRNIGNNKTVQINQFETITMTIFSDEWPETIDYFYESQDIEAAAFPSQSKLVQTFPTRVSRPVSPWKRKRTENSHDRRHKSIHHFAGHTSPENILPQRYLAFSPTGSPTPPFPIQHDPRVSLTG